MQTRIRALLPRLGFLSAVLALVAVNVADPSKPKPHENLRVLPKDLGREELGEVMLDILRGLGLPRRAGEGCLTCHVGSLDVPRADWDYASDEKPMKRKARVMLAMMHEINSTLAKLPDRSSAELEVTCYTCHAGRLDPSPLPEVLLAECERGGVGALERRYRSLRERYYEADAYDFRVHTLMRVASRLAATGEDDAAVRVHELNIEFHDEPEAHDGLIRLRMSQAFHAEGIDAMVARYHASKREHPQEAFQPQLLGPLAWQLFRSGERAAGMRLFELGYAEYPDAYVSTENLAWGLESTGEHERALRLAERWFETHPDHELGQRLLRELREDEERSRSRR